MKGDWISHDTHHLALGCMGLGGSWNDESYDQNHIKQAHSAIETALEQGIHFLITQTFTQGEKQKRFLENS